MRHDDVAVALQDRRGGRGQIALTTGTCIETFDGDIMFFVSCMQHTSLSPDGKLLTIVGDNPAGMLVDSSTGKVLVFPGHQLFKYEFCVVYVVI